MDVPDTMIRPSSLIGMDEQVFKAVCAPNHIELLQPQPQPAPHPNGIYPSFARLYIPMNFMTYQTFTPPYAPAEVSVRIGWLITTETLLTPRRREMG